MQRFLIAMTSTFLLAIALSLVPTTAFAEMHFGAVNPEHWQLPDLNPAELQPDIFYYGVLFGDKMYISTVHESGEAEIGQRSGGHFKILREHTRAMALAEGATQAEADERAHQAQLMQASGKKRFHDGIAFGFKLVKKNDGQLLVKWHGFNSTKSTIHGTSTGSYNSFILAKIIEVVQTKYRYAGIVAHPTNDPDLTLNPKYLDSSQEDFYRGEEALWEWTRKIFKSVETANKKLGFSNIDAMQDAKAISHALKDHCGTLLVTSP